MSFLKKIQKTVGELAQVGFDKVGIRYNPIDLGDDDDPDVQSRDVLDIYRDVMASWNGGAAVPVAQDMQAGLRAIAKRYAHDNREIKPAIEAWFGDRRTMNSTKFDAAHAHRSATSHRSVAFGCASDRKRMQAHFGILWRITNAQIAVDIVGICRLRVAKADGEELASPSEQADRARWRRRRFIASRLDFDDERAT